MGARTRGWDVGGGVVNEQQIIRAIKAHIAKGDKAAEKSEQHCSKCKKGQPQTILTRWEILKAA